MVLVIDIVLTFIMFYAHVLVTFRMLLVNDSLHFFDCTLIALTPNRIDLLALNLYLVEI